MKYIDLPFEEALKAKWMQGLNKHRQGDCRKPFTGEPLEEAYQECLDQTNYLIRCEETYDVDLTDARDKARSIAETLKRHYDHIQP
jgi:hypothetical protein